MKGKNFTFSIKVPGSITHEKLIGDTHQACVEMQEFQKTHLDLLSREGMLGAVLFQLPPYFKIEHIDKLQQLMESLDKGKFTCFVEPRNRELYNNREFSKAITDQGMNVASVDSPEIELSNNIHATSGTHYFRLHGRNGDQWFTKKSSKLQKYDYLYSKEQLESFKRIISPLAAKGDEIFVFFNNHPSGKAPANAMQMMGLLGFKPHVSEQRTLF